MEIHWKWKLVSYLGKKEQAMFLVVSVLNVHISFIGNTSKIAQVEKNLSSFVISQSDCVTLASFGRTKKLDEELFRTIL